MTKLTVRRAIDFTIGAVGLVIASPLIVSMITLARIESGKPGLFRQTRFGLHGKPFTIYKIRNLDDDIKPLRWSGMLRNVGLDELPQLINLVKGDMSLIGPRPDTRIEKIPGWSRMLDVPPGLTGLNAVIEKENGVVNLPEERVKIESEYVDRRLSGQWSLPMDMNILFKTAKVVVSGRADVGKDPERKAWALQNTTASQPHTFH